MTTQLDPHDYRLVSRLVASATEMVLLDRYWTAEAEAASTGEREVDLDALDEVVAQLERLLLEVDLGGRALVAASSRRSADLQANYDWLVSDQSPLSERHRRRVEEVAGADRDDLQAFVARTADRHAQQVDPERRMLGGEVRKLRGGVPSDGDLSPEEELLLAEVGMAVSIFVGPEALVVVEAVGHLIDWLFG